MHGRDSKKKPLLFKKNIATSLKFSKDRLDDLEGYWKNVLWTDEAKVEVFGLNEKRHVWRKPNTAFQHKNLIRTVKRGRKRLVEVIADQGNATSY